MAAPELLFAPPDGLGIQVQSSISKCAKQLQSQLLANVVVAGGLGAGLSGLSQRVEQEVHASTVLRVLLSSSRTWNLQFMSQAPAAGNAPWVGGSILSSLPTFDGFWMSAERCCAVLCASVRGVILCSGAAGKKTARVQCTGC